MDNTRNTPGVLETSGEEMRAEGEKEGDRK
jgi:hypothetical protein